MQVEQLVAQEGDHMYVRLLQGRLESVVNHMWDQLEPAARQPGVRGGLGRRQAPGKLRGAPWLSRLPAHLRGEYYGALSIG